MQRKLAVVLVVVSVALVSGGAAALAESGGAGILSPCAGFAEGQTVALRDSCFEGTAHFAQPGAITIHNEGVVTHSYTSADGTFDSGSLPDGGEATIHLDRPGVYRVYCVLHGSREGTGMSGVLVVGNNVEQAAATSSASSGGTSLVAWLAVIVGAALLAGSCGVALFRRTRSAALRPSSGADT